MLQKNCTPFSANQNSVIFSCILLGLELCTSLGSSLVVSSIKSSVQKTSSPVHRLLGPGRFYKKDENLFVSFSDNVLPWHSPLKHSSTCKVFKMVTQGSQRLEPVHFNCKAHNALSAKKQIRGYHEK